MTRKLTGLIIFLLGATFATPSFSAVTCNVTLTPSLDFGSVDPFQGGTVSTIGTLDWSCSRVFFDPPESTLCVFAGPDAGGNSNPREMTSSGQAVPFNVYDASSHSTPVLPASNGIAVLVDIPWCIFNCGPRTDSGSVPLYGQIPFISPTLAPGTYSATLTSQIYLVEGNANFDCNNASGAPQDTYALNAQVEIEKQCQLTANNLDFGTHSTPLPQTNADTFIDVRCTNTTPFTVGLSNGNHYTAGTRRMSDGNGNYVSYGLFQDASRSTEWDKTTNRRSDTGLGGSSSIMMTVFGQLPPQPSAVDGSYTDTVTVDIEF